MVIRYLIRRLSLITAKALMSVLMVMARLRIYSPRLSYFIGLQSARLVSWDPEGKLLRDRLRIEWTYQKSAGYEETRR